MVVRRQLIILVVGDIALDGDDILMFGGELLKKVTRFGTPGTMITVEQLNQVGHPLTIPLGSYGFCELLHTRFTLPVGMRRRPLTIVSSRHT